MPVEFTKACACARSDVIRLKAGLWNLVQSGSHGDRQARGRTRQWKEARGTWTDGRRRGGGGRDEAA